MSGVRTSSQRPAGTSPADAFRARFRANAAEALQLGASVQDLMADLLSVTGGGKPTDYTNRADASDLADLHTALLSYRTDPAPGGGA